jgi:hypothetical protein
MALDGYRDKDGELLSRKYGNNLIGRLLGHYGLDFAAGCSESDRVTAVLDQLDEASLNRLSANIESHRSRSVLAKSELYVSFISRSASFSCDPPSGEH